MSDGIIKHSSNIHSGNSSENAHINWLAESPKNIETIKVVTNDVGILPIVKFQILVVCKRSQKCDYLYFSS
jgi:hypothetical protein